MTHVDFADLHQRIAGAGTQVLLVWGRQDRVVPIEQAEELRGRSPALEFFPVDSAGHLPHLEQSAAVHARILDFLARHPTPSAVTPSPRPPAP